ELDGGRATVEGKTLDAHLSLLPGTPLSHLLLDQESCTLLLESVGRGQWRVERWGERFEVEVVDERTRHIRSLTGAGQKPAGPPVLKAPMPGLVVRVQVEVGQRVTLGAGVVVLEAMKMENELRAPAEAVVRAVHIRQGQAVEKGQVLVEFELSSGAAE
ncbi:MAG: acetyl-CoA carboxylase biotin carboxyl carrier protein subunit, partial [Gemmatimonadales bacterium]